MMEQLEASFRSGFLNPAKGYGEIESSDERRFERGGFVSSRCIFAAILGLFLNAVPSASLIKGI
jgi:hypothetical protein